MKCEITENPSRTPVGTLIGVKYIFACLLCLCFSLSSEKNADSYVHILKLIFKYIHTLNKFYRKRYRRRGKNISPIFWQIFFDANNEIWRMLQEWVNKTAWFKDSESFFLSINGLFIATKIKYVHRTLKSSGYFG